MQWLWIIRISIAQSEVNGYVHVDFTAAKDVVKKSYSIFTLEFIDPHLASWYIKCGRVSTIDEIAQGYFDITQLFMLTFTTGVKLENLEQNWLGIVAFTKCVGI